MRLVMLFLDPAGAPGGAGEPGEPGEPGGEALTT